MVCLAFVTNANAQEIETVNSTVSQVAQGHEASVTLSDLGFDKKARQYANENEVGLEFFTRANHVITEASLTLELSPANIADLEITHLDVLVNGELAGSVASGDFKGPGHQHTVPINYHLLEDRNLLSLRLRSSMTSACVLQVPVGSWRFINNGTLNTTSAALPTMNDLSTLPMPFYDARADASADIPVAILVTPNPDVVKASSLVASYFGMQTDKRVNFRPMFGEMPHSAAVVITTNDVAQEFGLPLVDGPTLAMIDHPSSSFFNQSILLVAGRDMGEVVAAAGHLALRPETLTGSFMTFDAPAFEKRRTANDAPRWIAPKGEGITLSEIAEEGQLVHRGLAVVP